MGKQHVRTTVEPDIHAHLEYLAEEAGKSLFVLAREVLTDYARQHTAPPVTTEQWVALRRWVVEDPTRIAEYTGPKKSLDAEGRAAIHQWALAHGYNPND